MDKLPILPAWDLVNKASLIKKFNFFPALLSTSYLSIIIFYQIAFAYVFIFDQKDQALALLLGVIHESYFWQMLGIGIFLFFLYIFLVPMARSGLVALIDGFLSKDRRKYRISYGISQSLLHFLPIFEFHNFMAIFRLLSIITFYLSSLRFMGMEYFSYITAGFIFYLFLALIVNMLFSYSQFFIIFEKKGLFEALSLSTNMTLKNIGITIKLYLLLFLLYLRTFVTVGMMLFFPAIASALFALSNSEIVHFALILTFIGIGGFFLVLLSHLHSVIEMFVETLWYKAYLNNKGPAAIPEA